MGEEGGRGVHRCSSLGGWLIRACLKHVISQGVVEHWRGDVHTRYSRPLDRPVME